MSRCTATRAGRHRARLRRAARRRRLRVERDPRPGPAPSQAVDDNDLAMMRRAITLAERAAVADEVPVGAVVYIGPRVVASAYNLRESATDPVAHAELLAISAAGRRLGRWRLTDCTVAVTLEPCPMCAGAMVNARVGRVIFGASDPKAGACSTLFNITSDARLNHEVKVVGGVMADECATLLRKFFRGKRGRKKS